MIKLKNILNENRSILVDTKSAIECIKNINIPFDDILEKHIYRGNDHIRSNFYYINPKSSIRESAHTSNYYTLCMDNFPEWKEYPKRSNGIICTNDLGTAEDYGNVYRVIPLSENAKIGICPKWDIWVSFSQNLSSVNTIIENGFSFVNNYLLTINNPEIEVKNDIELLTKIIKKYSYTYIDLVHAFDLMNKYKNIIWEEFNECNNGVFTKKDNFLKSYEKFLNPNENGFKLETFNTYHTNYEANNEIWLDSECILINENIIEKFKNKYYKEEKHD